MLFSADRFEIAGDFLIPRSGSEWEGTHGSYILDWDTRRWYLLIAPTECMPVHGTTDDDVEEGNDAIDILGKFFDVLSPDAYSITVDARGLLQSISPGGKARPSQMHHTIPFKSAPHLEKCLTVHFSQLVETDRIAPGVDRVFPQGQEHLDYVFKYGLTLMKDRFIWKEVSILSMLPKHRHILALEHVVLSDEPEPCILGFTSRFIAGGDLNNNPRPFKLKWLQQLTETLDFLNLELGIVNRDISAKNLLIDEVTDDIILFDFGIACTTAQVEWRNDDVDDAVITLYEIITHDDSVRQHYAYNGEISAAEIIFDKPTWLVKGELACEVSFLRKHVEEWYHRRLALLNDGSMDGIKNMIIPLRPAGFDLAQNSGAEGENLESNKRKWNSSCWERPEKTEAFAWTKKQKLCVS
ncbi:hypothetical protein BKA67DRAFT_652251 [Truncatella angustata]|uniref:Protein kinase domain-containing protein n=1 Tax=Truncatella angustata TaxID=152316 RepID=A0A9P8UV90_9PEZI|nr:uncharacterized protein BKA67DRAFT_652251 [Truncatella angustata]KAH6658977.1 hypothetical protein BKA67DRAFT_652251 [Truncatella angustata]